MKKYYIDRDEWIERLQKEYDSCENKERKAYLLIQMNSIRCQPTVTKEDILKEESDN